MVVVNGLNTRVCTTPTEITKDNNVIGLKFNVACNVTIGNKVEPMYYECTLFRNNIENIKKFLVIGKQITFTGLLKSSTWLDDKKRKHDKLEIMIDQLFFVGTKTETNEKELETEKIEESDDKSEKKKFVK